VIENAGPDTLAVRDLHAAAGSGRLEAHSLALAWPPAIFSLSHVALPFPPDDPLYGYDAAPDPAHVQLGRLEARGENGVLAIPTWMLTRLRSNPFYAFVSGRVQAFVAPDPPPAPAPDEPAAAAGPAG
jgi:hypothetical protein